MRLKIFGTLFSAVAFVSGCTNEDKAAETTGAFLSIADFSATKATSTTLEKAINSLVSADTIKDTVDEPEDRSQSDDASDKCQFQNEPKSAIVGQTLSISGFIDASECVKAAAADSPFPLTGLTLKIAANLTCEGADFSEYVGKGFDDLDFAAIAEKKCGTADRKTFTNYEMKIGIGDKSVSILIGEFSKDGGACVSSVDGSKFKLNDCIYASFMNPSFFGDGTENELLILTAENVVDSGQANATWFESGKFNVVANNFTGSLTYSSPTTAPTYTLTNGTETKTAAIDSANNPSGVETGFAANSSSVSHEFPTQKSVKSIFKHLTRRH